jgi:hypothetical protein
MKGIVFSIILLFISIQLYPQHTVNKLKLPAELKEISGLEKFNDSILIAINDSGNSPFIFFIDLKGEIIKKTFVSNALNIDWEDLTIDDEGNLYIADVGNNDHLRKDLCILKLNAQQAFISDSIRAEKIYFTYTDQPDLSANYVSQSHDCEAVFWFEDSLHLLTKITTKPKKDYWYNGTSDYMLSTIPGTYSVRSKTHYWTGGNNRLKHQVTACDNLNNVIAILTYGFVYFYQIGSPRIVDREPIEFKRLTQKESLVYFSSTKIFVAAEKHWFLGGPFLYTIDLK